MRRFLLPLLYLAAATVLPARATAAANVVVIASLDELRAYAAKDGVKVRLKPGVYRLDRATEHHFIRFTGHDSHFDLRGVTLQIDNRLFRQFGVRAGPDGFYCVIDLVGDRIVFEGLATENVGDVPGIGSRNKIINVSGSDVTVRDVVVTTSGSSPWGYGSLYGISGGDVRKMNGIRVGAPAKNVKLIGCRVHMRAMGHAIFVQGAEGTLIQDCHVDGLLKPTKTILAEKSGYAFDRKFLANGRDYIEGVKVGAEGQILPDEMIALSEDGIRMYDRGGPDRTPTGSTTIVDCTVTRMRRGICTGLGPAADTVINCEARECVAAGFNVGSGDTLENCRADAKFSEALCLPYMASRAAKVDLEILDSREGLPSANTVIAVINGRGHDVRLRARQAEFVPEGFTVELATQRGYAFYQRNQAPLAADIALRNETRAQVNRP